MALFGRGKKPPKPPRKNTRDREMKAGAAEYEARHQERLAARRESQGDIDGARIAREAAEAARGNRKPSR